MANYVKIIIDDFLQAKLIEKINFSTGIIGLIGLSTIIGNIPSINSIADIISNIVYGVILFFVLSIGFFIFAWFLKEFWGETRLLLQGKSFGGLAFNFSLNMALFIIMMSGYIFSVNFIATAFRLDILLPPSAEEVVKSIELIHPQREGGRVVLSGNIKFSETAKINKYSASFYYKRKNEEEYKIYKEADSKKTTNDNFQFYIDSKGYFQISGVSVIFLSDVYSGFIVISRKSDPFLNSISNDHYFKSKVISEDDTTFAKTKSVIKIL